MSEGDRENIILAVGVVRETGRILTVRGGNKIEYLLRMMRRQTKVYFGFLVKYSD